MFEQVFHFVAELAPALLVLGAALALLGDHRRARCSTLIASFALGFIGLQAAFWAGFDPSKVKIFLAALDVAAIVGGLVVLAVPLLARPKASAFIFGLYGVAFVWGLKGALDFIARTRDLAVADVSILNSDMVMLVGGLVLFSAVAAAFSYQANRLTSRLPALLPTVLAGGIGVLLVCLWLSDLLLVLLQLGALRVDRLLISVIARTQNAENLLLYVTLAAFTVLLVAVARGRQAIAPELAGPRRRLAVRGALSRQRLLRGSAATLVVLLASGLLYDLYLSRPPRLSEATDVASDASGLVRIAIADVSDGSLHRFAYTATDGSRVRFFLVNKYGGDRVDIGVVFDACTICGSAGYIERGGEIYCVACGVRMLKSSIGSAGGCNPIPLTHQVTDGMIVIDSAEIEAGAAFFDGAEAG